MRRKLLSIIIIGIFGLFSMAGAKELIVKKSTETVIKKYEAGLENILGKDVVIPMLSGVIKIGQTSFVTRAPFYLSKNVDWEFLCVVKPISQHRLVNNNENIKWFYRVNELDKWEEIKERYLTLADSNKIFLKFVYKAPDATFNIHRVVEREPLCGFIEPVYFVKNHKLYPVTVEPIDISDKGILRLKLLSEGPIKGKISMIFEMENGKRLVKKLKLIPSGGKEVTMDISPIMSIRSYFKIKVLLYVNGRKFTEKIIPVNTVKFAYESPDFFKNRKKVQLKAVFFTPQFEYVSLFIDPQSQNRLFRKLYQSGFNTLIIPYVYATPLLVDRALANHLYIIAEDVDNAGLAKLQKRFSGGCNLLSGIITKEIALAEKELFNGIVFAPLNRNSDNIVEPDIKRAPYVELSYFSNDYFTNLLHFLQKRGGMVVNTGRSYCVADSVLRAPEHGYYFRQLLNESKVNSAVKLSAAYYSLTPVSLTFPYIPWFQYGNCKTFPDYLLDNSGYYTRKALTHIALVESEVPVIEDKRNEEEGGKFSFVILGILTFFSFTFYLLRLKTFRYYFGRAISKPYGFFTDLNEKIAVPWSETLMLLLYSGMGVAVSLGSYLFIYKKAELMSEIINTVSPSINCTVFLIKVIYNPLALILLILFLFIAFKFIVGISMRLVFMLFHVNVKLKHCIAIAVWSNVLWALYIPVALIAYNSILVFQLSNVFWISFLLLILIAFFRLNKAIFLTTGIKKYKIYLTTLILGGMVVGLLHIMGFDFPQIYYNMQELLVMYR